MEPFDAPEDLLTAAQAFKPLADCMNWTDDECNRIFESCLVDAAAADWADTVTNINGTFHDTLEAFALKCIPEPNVFLTLQACMTTVRMTRRFTICTCISRLMHINTVASVLPQANGNNLLTDN